MSQQIMVRIYRGQKLIAEVERPLREVAGVTSVKYHRKSWRLLPGNRIEIDKPPLDGNESGGTNSIQAPVNRATGEGGMEAPKGRRLGAGKGESIIDFARKIELELDS